MSCCSLTLALTGVVALGFVALPSATGQILTTSSPFTMRHGPSGRVADVAGVSIGDGAVVNLWDRINPGLNQVWYQARPAWACNHPNAVQLRVAHTDKCLTVRDMSTNDEAGVIQYTCEPDRPNQLWEFQYSPNGHINIIGVGSGKCLVSYHAGNTNGTPLVIFPCAGQGTLAEWDMNYYSDSSCSYNFGSLNSFLNG